MDNSGQGRLRVPGFGGIPLCWELSTENRFANSMNGWEKSPPLTVRELAMLQLMNRLTDKDDWHIEIFNDTTVAKWREETVENEENLEIVPAEEDRKIRVTVGTRLISAKAWDWCLRELRDKALLLKQNQFVRVLDAGSSVCKSDTLISEPLRVGLRDSIAPMLEQREADKDWYPSSRKIVRNLVDDSLFPLIYGKTPVLVDGGQVGLDDCLEAYGGGTVEPYHPDMRGNITDVKREVYEKQWRSFLVQAGKRWNRWSYNFQLLPCEVKFNGETGIDVRITSYINNLHPVHYKSLYCNIEKLISSAIKPWNECLIKGEKDRWPIRIRTYGLKWDPEYPKGLADFVAEGLSHDPKTDAFKEAMKETERYLKLPARGSNRPAECPKDWEKVVLRFLNHSSDCAINFITDKWKTLRQIYHPESGTAFSYHEWKVGLNGRAIREKSNYWEPKTIVQPDPDHEFYSIKLEETFRDKGLQVLVKIASIELTPDQPWYNNELTLDRPPISRKNWRVDGLSNEHVVARAIYYYDVENVTPTQISFRHIAKFRTEDYHFDMERGTAPGELDEPESEYISSMLGLEAYNSPVQELGSVSVPQGRLITWPSTLNHRLEPFTLVDPTTPGHRRFIMLSLVDPNFRVCSTQNVPPQRHDWWAEAVHTELASRGIPGEVAQLITDKTGEWPLSMDEAKINRKRLAKERKWAQEAFLGKLSDIQYGDDY